MHLFLFSSHTRCVFLFLFSVIMPGGHPGFVYRVFAAMADYFDEDERRRAVYGLLFLFFFSFLFKALMNAC